ncbi:hypothetical protein AB0N09_35840 [Streptomyces erythrochromogenes]|uniref:hypothetical protein n=1 Tax=Streptomyces erythrochromogenes TaxID=285574 RepID=UPI003424A526
MLTNTALLVRTFEVRLLDPNGYSVIAEHRVPKPEVEALRDLYLSRDAVEHATEWADIGYRLIDYRVRVFEVTGR